MIKSYRRHSGKIDSNLIEKASGNFVREKPVLIEPYVLTKENFQRDIVPTFSCFELLPNPYMKDGQGSLRLNQTLGTRESYVAIRNTCYSSCQVREKEKE